MAKDTTDKTKVRRGWVVTARCVVRKEFILADCTEAEARANPLRYVIDERDIEHVDWDVLSVEPND